MAIDMGQFHQVFFEESFEGLEVMESGLLDMDHGVVDSDEINAIFRAAHSIKGGSGTFGFTEISEFTHVVETLLDEMRDGSRAVTEEAVSTLLASVDVIRSLLTAARDGHDADKLAVQNMRTDLQEILNSGDSEGTTKQTAPKIEIPESQVAVEPQPESEPEPESKPNEEPDPEVIGWHIVFRPLPHMCRTGNDPLRIIRELGRLGELQVEADLSIVPGFAKIDPECCYMFWNMHLMGDVERADVDDIFDWVEDDCDLVVVPILRDLEEEIPAKKEEQKTVEINEQKVEQKEEPKVLPKKEQNIQEEKPEEPEVAFERRKDGRRKADRRNPLDRRKADRRSATGVLGSSSIRVDITKVDSLINMVGELVITQSMLSLLGEQFAIERLDRLKEGLEQLERHTRDLQESVMLIRMLPISFAFNRFPRMVHDLSVKMGKQVELKMIGQDTEVDKTVIEKIGDPLVHLVRNSLDHGIESSEIRKEAGKPEVGTIELNAQQKGGNIIIQITDDGAGLPKEHILEKAIARGLVEEGQELTDRQIYELIFLPGFSTADTVSDISGRGVGMDVVRRNVLELGGSIGIDSEKGVGSTFTIRLPLTLAILDGQIIKVGSDTYIMPLVSIIESLQMHPSMINTVAGRGETVKLRDEYLPIIRLHEVFNVDDARTTDLCSGLLVVVEGDGRRCGLFVDDLIGQQQVVVKSLEDNYQHVEGISGATILGDGSVAMILDVQGIFNLASSRDITEENDEIVLDGCTGGVAGNV